ncbi:hypothetical protein KP509_30G074600 [Ceratopteris richardii]|uniref:F-box domain-containing protein n=1 Tax=Ceratopteris richardii TaxID=49495 RepID=A0A8T2R501_CERRI|nr:hypothetical protein KP509_30G074600 [Ceratopteris richardii]
MENREDFFLQLPNEVLQLIFSRINDFKTLAQCMSVSRTFRQQAMQVSSLIIVCPGSFSSFDERLRRIFCMVKAFRNLQSLVVRVGQPREEPPSWARCMRYVEIGNAVEKFMFMAAKGGDFSELDSTLLGVDSSGKSSPGSHSVASLSNVHADTNFEVKSQSVNNADMANLNGNTTAIGASCKKDSTNTENGNGTLLSEVEDTPVQPRDRSPSYGVTSFDVSMRRNPLSHFTLRQVIAPSNDVLKRMLPVIHFAIVQGLNELRDSLPTFVAQFANLRSFLLVDMVESITVFLREHHIQELKSSYLQDLEDSPSVIQDTSEMVDHCSQSSLAERNQELSGTRHFEFPDSIHPNSTQITQNASCIESINKDHSLRQNSHEPQKISAINDGTHLFKKFNRLRLQTLKGKEKLTDYEESDSQGLHISSSSDCCYHGTPSNIIEHGEGSHLGECSSFCRNDRSLHLKMSELEISHINASVSECGMNSHNGLAPLDALGSNSNTHSGIPETISESGHDVGRGELGWDCFRHDDNTVRFNNHNLHGSKYAKDSRLDFTNKCSLRRSNKVDAWKKKGLARVLTGIKETADVFSNHCSQAWNDPRSITAPHEGALYNVHGSVSECREGPCACDSQNTSLPSSCFSQQAIVSEAHENSGGSVVHVDSWQEQRKRSYDISCVQQHSDDQTSKNVPPCKSTSEAHEDTNQNIDRNCVSQRERVRDLVWRKRHRVMEKDALSFDYTFWRVERVSSCDYVMSDISMCIATHAARPLEDSEKEVLTNAAIAGPFLVETVSHINSHYSCHHL